VNRKMVALVLIGAMIAVPMVLANYRKNDCDTQTGTYGIAIASVVGLFNDNGQLIDSDHDWDGGVKPGATLPSGWSAPNVGNGATGSTWAKTSSYTYVLDEYEDIYELVKAIARVDA